MKYLIIIFSTLLICSCGSSRKLNNSKEESISITFQNNGDRKVKLPNFSLRKNSTSKYLKESFYEISGDTLVLDLQEIYTAEELSEIAVGNGATRKIITSAKHKEVVLQSNRSGNQIIYIPHKLNSIRNVVLIYNSVKNFAEINTNENCQNCLRALFIYN